MFLKTHSPTQIRNMALIKRIRVNIANLLENTLNPQDELSPKLTKIGANSEGAIKVYVNLKKQTASMRKTMNDMGVTTGSLTQKLSLLKAEREWIPAINIGDLRTINKL